MANTNSFTLPAFRRAWLLLSTAALPIVCLGQVPGASQPAQVVAESPVAESQGNAYYNYAMGHLYSELSSVYGNRKEFLDQAIDYYKEALKLDPKAGFLNAELSELYLRSGRVAEAVTEAERRLKENPNDLDARRILGRIYTRLIGDPNAPGSNRRSDGVNEEMLRKAIEQHEFIVKADPSDTDSQLLLGRLYRLDRRNVDAESAFKKVLETDSNNDVALRELALVYSSLGDTNKAIEMYTRVNSRNPTPRTLLELASAYEQVRDFANAATVYKKVVDLNPEEVDVLKRYAQALLFADKLDEARAAYQTITAKKPDDVEGFLRLSQIYRQQGNFEAARSANEKAKSLAPDNLEILYNDINLLDAEGRADEAIERLKSMIQTAEKARYTDAELNARMVLLERLGLLQRSTERYADAIGSFTKLAEADPNQAGRAQAQIVETYRMAKDFTKAEAVANEAYKKYPEDRTLIVVRASLLADLGKSDEAIRDMKAFMKGREDHQNYLTLSQIYEKAKRYPEMAEALTKAEEFADGDDEIQTVTFMRGAMYERQKDFEKAEAEFRKVLARNPENASALNYLGYMLADRNVRLEESFQMIKKAVDLDPGNAAYLDSLGWIYYRMGKLHEAELALKQALQRMSKDPTIHDHLGDVYFEQGDLRQAVIAWELALKEWKSNAPSERDAELISNLSTKLEKAKVSLAQQTGEPGSRP
ncbi:MAG: tetratricopeptide repeat protein [Bryobacterales bacterium]|nr:tetratricopeptide repeat protein [Bryobacterales bacterium]